MYLAIMGNGFPMVAMVSERAKREKLYGAISHVGDFSISGSGAFVSYLSGAIGNECGVKVFDGNGEIYLGIWIKNASNDFVCDGGIFDESRIFTGATLSPNDYDGGIRDISILPSHAK